MTKNPYEMYERKKDNDKDKMRLIPIVGILHLYLFQIVQTQDVLHIGFHSDNNHLDIDIHEFLDFRDIYYQIKDRLQELGIDPAIQLLILLYIGKQSETIQENIEYFGVPHIFDRF